MTILGTAPALTYTYTGLVGGDSSASFTGALARASGNSIGAYGILQNTLTATGNYTIGAYNPGVFTINAPAIPNSVASVTQAPSLNTFNSSNSWSFATNAPVIWQNQPDVYVNIVTPLPTNKPKESSSDLTDIRDILLCSQLSDLPNISIQ